MNMYFTYVVYIWQCFVGVFGEASLVRLQQRPGVLLLEAFIFQNGGTLVVIVTLKP